MTNSTNSEKRINERLFDALLTPSWLSGLIAIAAGLVVTIGVVLAFSFNTSQIQQQLGNLQNTSKQSVLTLPGQTPPGTTANSLQNTWPLLAFWGVVGLVVYFIVETIAKAISNAAALREELYYVHAKRDTLIKMTVEYLVIRLIIVAFWLIFIDLFLKRIIPYSITASHAAASDPKSLSAFLYILLSFVMIAGSLHLHAIFLRLIARRPRVFSATIL